METIEYGTITIDFEIKYTDRKTLGINVYPDGLVIIIAPYNSEMEAIKKKVLKRASWIVKQKDYFNNIKRLEAPREYVSGETHKYLGRSYRLKVEFGEAGEVKMKGGFFIIKSKTKERKKIKALLDKWYIKHALKKFRERLDICFEEMKHENIEYPKLELRRMPKRWGSCTPEGKIFINPELIKAPVYCIDYVMVHELCHLKIHNHSPAFYDLKTKYMPDWEERKRLLEAR
ncbi:MAG TPA: M48 family peptidase [Bacteroidetes bacterium]|nr:M48 family peptidase [Bacteroidota bacterium]